MLKRKTLICAVLGLLLSSLFARPPLLAQSHSALTVWSTPVNLGPVINSPYTDQHPAISKDGLSLYFTSDRPGGFGGLDLWVSQRGGVDIPWGPAMNLGPNINTSGNENAPNLSIDGHRLYFGSIRPGGFGSSDIYVSHRQDKGDDFGWEVPLNLGPNINTPAAENGPSIFEDETTGVTTLYFTSDRPGIGGFDIYASTQKEDDSFYPAVIVPELSSPYRDTRLAIRRDGLEIFISSERPGGVDLRDLWVSTRLTTSDPWGTPVDLGAPINTTALEGAPALSFDGTTLYFFSNRAGGFGGFDLYVTTRGKLHPEELDGNDQIGDQEPGDRSK